MAGLIRHDVSGAEPLQVFRERGYLGGGIVRSHGSQSPSDELWSTKPSNIRNAGLAGSSSRVGRVISLRLLKALLR